MSHLGQIIITYKALLTGDNLPERVAVQTVVLQTLLDAAAATTAKPVDVAAVREINPISAGASVWINVDENKDGSQEFTVVEVTGLDDAPDGDYLFIRALSPAEPVALPQDVIDLVIAGRELVYSSEILNGSQEADKFDKALEAFASRVPWDNEPDEDTAALKGQQHDKGISNE